MNGDRYLLDTNAIVALLRGHASLVERLRQAAWVGISILSQIEFLAFPDLSNEDKSYFAQFLERVEVVGLDREHPRLIERVVEVRRTQRLKLPDAIIVATALHSAATLVTEDQQLLNLAGISSMRLA